MTLSLPFPSWYYHKLFHSVFICLFFSFTLFFLPPPFLIHHRVLRNSMKKTISLPFTKSYTSLSLQCKESFLPNDNVTRALLWFQLLHASSLFPSVLGVVRELLQLFQHHLGIFLVLTIQRKCLFIVMCTRFLKESWVNPEERRQKGSRYCRTTSVPLPCFIYHFILLLPKVRNRITLTIYNRVFFMNYCPSLPRPLFLFYLTFDYNTVIPRFWKERERTTNYLILYIIHTEDNKANRS